MSKCLSLESWVGDGIRKTELNRRTVGEFLVRFGRGERDHEMN